MSLKESIDAIVTATSWTQRIQQIRLIPQKHGTEDYVAIYAAVARQLYMPHLAPDFAYIHQSSFYEPEHFFSAYDAASALTDGFCHIEVADLEKALIAAPTTLLVFRTLLGLTRDEFSHSTVLAGGPLNLTPLSSGQIDTMERAHIEMGRKLTTTGLSKVTAQAKIAANTISMVMAGALFGAVPPGLRSKQHKPDTQNGWKSVRSYAKEGVPLKVLLHQRHYGGAFRQVLDATSTQRGNLIEDVVETLFVQNGISFIRTGSHNQAEITERFEVHVVPAPDFVVFDPVDGSLRALLECKGTNNGGTARDKALRFTRLRAEAVRLGGIPLIAVLGGIGWARINDALGPVVRDTDGRVFTLSTLHSMLSVAPFPALMRFAKVGE